MLFRSLQLAKAAYNSFVNENIREIGNLLYQSWLEKRKISNQIATSSVNNIITTCIGLGAYGAKLLGAGGCGFVLVICHPNVKKRIKETFGNSVLDFDFDNSGNPKIRQGLYFVSRLLQDEAFFFPIQLLFA